MLFEQTLQALAFVSRLYWICGWPAVDTPYNTYFPYLISCLHWLVSLYALVVDSIVTSFMVAPAGTAQVYSSEGT